MCGIVAMVGQGDEGVVSSMVERIAHRGPDGAAVHLTRSGNGHVEVLGHCRLAIIDPAGGRQPIIDPRDANRRAMVVNGMIYNYRQLRSRFGEGRFASGSDSESIFHTCLDRGAGGVSDLDGMFAFIFVNRGRVLAARDPIGIKPLYMGTAGDTLHFASEIKALADVADDVRAFPPGYVFDSARDEESLFPYYEIPAARPHDRSERDAVAQVRRTLEEAVAKRMQSDVPLGCFLSGGLDSSIVAALARRHRDSLHTFAVGIEGSDDMLAARRVAEHLDTVHHEYTITADDVLRDLPDILYHLESYDQDLVRSAVPCWFVSRLAADRVKVVLTGEGADELFAGYTYHKTYDDRAALGNELRRAIGAMHDVNLQRVDRMTMAHGLEARVPFLDRDMIDLGMRIDPALKLRTARGRRTEKWILRAACADLLPDDIVWRVKQQFDEGSGLSDLLQRLVPEHPPEVTLPDGRRPRGPEEAWYASRMIDRFGSDSQVFNLVTRWSDGRLD